MPISQELKNLKKCLFEQFYNSEMTNMKSAKIERQLTWINLYIA
jgi:hypothetical protein